MRDLSLSVYINALLFIQLPFSSTGKFARGPAGAYLYSYIYCKCFREFNIIYTTSICFLLQEESDLQGGQRGLIFIYMYKCFLNLIL